jgi:hypothetical protein
MNLTFRGFTTPNSGNVRLSTISQLQKSLDDHGKHFGHHERKKVSIFGFAPNFQKFFRGVSTPTSLLISLGGIGSEVF